LRKELILNDRFLTLKIEYGARDIMDSKNTEEALPGISKSAQ